MVPLVGVGASILVLLLVASSLGAVNPSGDRLPSARSGHGPDFTTSSPGGAELRGARSSLERGAVPALDPVPSVSLGAYQWTNLTPLVGVHPSTRYLPSMTWDAADGYVLVFGGTFSNVSTSYFLGDTWTYLNGTWQNITNTVVGSPPKLAGAALAYDPAQSAVILFGGALTETASSNVTYSYARGVWTNITTTVGRAPSPRYATSMVWDSNDSELVLTGGLAANGVPVPGTWVFKGAAWSNITATAPIPALLYTPNLADDPADHGVLASSIMSYSSTGHAPFYPGTFLFDGGKWHNLTPTLALEPPMLYVGAMAYVSPAVGVLLITGVITNRSGDFVPGGVVWEYHAGAWSNITSTVGAGPRSDGASGVALIPTDQSILVLGGVNLLAESSTSQVWVFSAAPLVNATATLKAVDVGVPVTFHGNITRGLSPVAGAWAFGDGGSGSSLSVSHSFTVPGVYTVTFTATDSLGRVGTASVSVTVYSLPTASISVSPSPPTAGNPAVLVANVTGGTPPLSYQWNLGDGTTATTAVVTHTYSQARTYSVSLVVTDGGGKTSGASASVAVNASSPSGSSGGSSNVDLTSGTGLALLAGIVVLAAVAAVFAVLWIRKPKSPSGAPSPYVGPTGPAVPPPPPPGAG
jgi:PKD repeat protein